MVKPGYKQTEIGVIPEDWEVLYFRDCFEILPNNTLPRTELNNDEGTAKNIHYGDILVKYGSLLNCSKASIPYITNPSLHITSKPLVDGDIVIADTAEDETVGKAVEITDAGNQLVVPGLHTIPCRATDSNMFATGWLGFFLNSSVYHDQLLPLITGTKVSAISKMSISDTVILVPPFSEQKRIAEALSDVDELIASLEKLLAKKKAIKQGAMQELLTGKRRLPGFSGEWEKRKLSTYCSLITKQTGFDYSAHIKPALIKESLPGTLPMIQTINFRGKHFTFDTDYYIPKSVASQFPNIVLSSKCVLFSIVGASVGNIGLYPGGISFCGGAIGITRFYNENDAEWVFYYMSSPEGQSQINYVTKGGAQVTVTIADIRNFIIPTPGKEEREAIVRIMSDLDDEILNLENRLEKARQIKHGMMQQLLTGKIRLL